MQDNMIHWSPGMSLESVEKQTILAAYRHFRGNKTQTAISLGIAIRTLDNKLEQYEKEGNKDKERQDEFAKRQNDFLARQKGFTTGVDGSIVPIVERRIYGKAKDAERDESNGAQGETGLRVQPASEASAEQSMPLPIGAEVQSVSSKHASGNRSGKRR